MVLGILNDIFEGVKICQELEYDRTETCRDTDSFIGVFKHAKRKGFGVAIKNDETRAQYGFVVEMPLFSSVERVWYKIDARDIYSRYQFGYMI